jgi:hypothetical protein
MSDQGYVNCKVAVASKKSVTILLWFTVLDGFGYVFKLIFKVAVTCEIVLL